VPAQRRTPNRSHPRVAGARRGADSRADARTGSRTDARGDSRTDARTDSRAPAEEQVGAAAPPAPVASSPAGAGGTAPAADLATADTRPAPEQAPDTDGPVTKRPVTKRPTPGPLPRPRQTRTRTDSPAPSDTTEKKDTAHEATAKARTEEAADTQSRTSRSGTRKTPVRPNQLWFAAAVLAAITLALGILATSWLGSYRQAQAREQAWQQALPAAKENVARLFSYDYRHIKADRDSVATLLTGQFRTDYLSSMDKLVIPQAPAKKFVLVSTTQSAGVSSVTEDGHQAVVIVFLNQAISNTDVKARTDLVRLRVTMTQVGGRWLISEVKSV
jgi:Mce-associated membrane protein